MERVLGEGRGRIGNFSATPANSARNSSYERDWLGQRQGLACTHSDNVVTRDIKRAAQIGYPERREQIAQCRITPYTGPAI